MHPLTNPYIAFEKSSSSFWKIYTQPLNNQNAVSDIPICIVFTNLFQASDKLACSFWQTNFQFLKNLLQGSDKGICIFCEITMQFLTNPHAATHKSKVCSYQNLTSLKQMHIQLLKDPHKRDKGGGWQEKLKKLLCEQLWLEISVEDSELFHLTLELCRFRHQVTVMTEIPRLHSVYNVKVP